MARIPTSELAGPAQTQGAVRANINQAAPVLDGIKRGVDKVEQSFIQGVREGTIEAEKINRTRTELRNSNTKKAKSQAAIDEVRFRNELNQRLTQPDVSTENALDVISDFNESFQWSELPKEISEDQKIELEQTRALAIEQIVGGAETSVFQKVEGERIKAAEEAAGAILGEHGEDGLDMATSLLLENGFSGADAGQYTGAALAEIRKQAGADFTSEIKAEADAHQQSLDIDKFAELDQLILENPNLSDSEKQTLFFENEEKRNRALVRRVSMIAGFMSKTDAGTATFADWANIAAHEDVIPPKQFAALQESYAAMKTDDRTKDTSYRKDGTYQTWDAEIKGMISDDNKFFSPEKYESITQGINESGLGPAARSELIKKLQMARRKDDLSIFEDGNEVDTNVFRFSDREGFTKEDFLITKDDLTFLNAAFQGLPEATDDDLLLMNRHQDTAMVLARSLNSKEEGTEEWKTAKGNYDRFILYTKAEWMRKRLRQERPAIFPSQPQGPQS